MDRSGRTWRNGLNCIVLNSTSLPIKNQLFHNACTLNFNSVKKTNYLEFLEEDLVFVFYNLKEFRGIPQFLEHFWGIFSKTAWSTSGYLKELEHVNVVLRPY